MRSQANTARLFESNPTLMRLRELEVLEVIAAGSMSDKDIADSLYISPATAGTHVKNILRKSGLSSRRDLVLLSASDQP